MQVGYFAIGIGLGADPGIVTTTAQTCEQAGFHSLWAPEHIVLLDQYSSKYPYSPDGRLPMPTTQIDILDPFAALTFAAAQTKSLRLGTGICLVPERNPVVTAKEVASLDKLSGGRFDFGVGVGWLAEEFTAVGVPWEKRGQRTREYLEVMKKLWTEEETEFSGQFCSFPKVRSYPKPIQRPHPPIIFGGESKPALRRVGEVGDGWFGVNVSPPTAKEHIEQMRSYASAAGRDSSNFQYSVSKGIGTSITMDEVKAFRDAGVHQVIVGGFSEDASTVKADIEKLAEQIVVPSSKL